VLDCHNGKCADAARTKMIPLSRAYQGPLWETLCESLDAFSRAHIQEAVDHALAADGISIAPSQAEHRLRIWESV